MKTKRRRRPRHQKQLGCEQLECRQMLAAAGADSFVAAPGRIRDDTNLSAVIDSQPNRANNQGAPRNGGGGNDRGRANSNGDGRRAPRPSPIQPNPLVPAPLGPLGSSQAVVNPQQRISPPANSSPQQSVVTANQALAQTPNPPLGANLPPAQTIPATAGQIQTVAPALRGPTVVVNGVPAPSSLPAVPPRAPAAAVAVESVSANVGQVPAATDVRVDAPQSDSFVNPSDAINESNTRFISAPLSTTADLANASLGDATDAPLNRSNASAVEPLFASLVDFVSEGLVGAGISTGLISVAEYFGFSFDSLDQDDEESIVADMEVPATEDVYLTQDRAEEPADAFFELLGDGGLIDFDDDFEEITEAGELQDSIALGDVQFAVLDGAAAALPAEQRIQRLLQRLDRRRDEAQTNSAEDGHNANGRVVDGESDSAQRSVTSRIASSAQSISTVLIKSDGSCAKWQAFEMATGPGDDAIGNDGAPAALASEGKEVSSAAS